VGQPPLGRVVGDVWRRAGRANLRSRFLRMPSAQVAVVAVLNGHFLCQFVRIALIIGCGQRPFFATNCGGNILFEEFTAAAVPVTAALVVGATGTAEHCDSEERVTCESG
jgi:hypothetical protein